MIKKLLSALAICLLCTACTKRKTLSPFREWMQNNGKIKVLSTIAQIGDLVIAVGGDKIDCLVLVPKELDPHSYEIVKGDDEKLKRADLIFYNGLGLEHGAGLFSLLNQSPKAIALGFEIQKIAPNQILEKDGVVDPHIWMDISLWKLSLRSIVEKLSQLDPDGANYYETRAKAFEKEMELTHLYIQNLLKEIPTENRYLVTSHDAFRYFARSYLADPDENNWFGRFTAPEGLAPDGQLSPQDIRQAIAFLQEHKIHVVFPESNISRDSVAKIASASSELGFEIFLCQEPLYGDSTGGLSYLDMMRMNAEVISQNLRVR